MGVERRNIALCGQNPYYLLKLSEGTTPAGSALGGWEIRDLKGVPPRSYEIQHLLISATAFLSDKYSAPHG
jgi:hypothetical protein